MLLGTKIFSVREIRYKYKVKEVKAQDSYIWNENTNLNSFFLFKVFFYLSTENA